MYLRGTVSVTHRVTSFDETSIAFEAAGPPDAPAVVLLHGIAQSREAFRPLLDGPLSRSLRLVAVDLRGHGDSGAPADPAAYTDGAPLGRDLRAVIDALGLARPWVLAWSYAGVAVGEYLRTFGGADLGGLALCAAAVAVGRDARAWCGPGMMLHARGLMSDDGVTYAAAARAFAAGCTAALLAPDVLAAAERAMQRVPAHVRRALLTRSDSFVDAVARCEAPVVTLHGDADTVVLPAMSQHIAAMRPGTRAVEFAGVGHLPWVEAPEAFADALGECVLGGQRTRASSEPRP